MHGEGGAGDLTVAMVADCTSTPECGLAPGIFRRWGA